MKLGIKGNISFYIVVSLPIVTTLAMLGVDMSSYQALRQHAQREADRIVLEASRHLPNSDLARAYTLNQITEDPALEIAEAQDGGQLIDVTSSTVSLVLKGVHASAFDFFLSSALEEEHFFTAFARAQASVRPQDTFLIVDDAASFRPAAGTAWGDASEWPESTYFHSISAPSLSFTPPNQPPLHWPSWWEASTFNSETFRRWATQLCYNPIYTHLKLSALRLANTLSASPLSRLGLLHTPGDSGASGQGFSVTRELTFSDEPSARLNWSSYYETRSANSDEACLYYADPLTSDSRYELPTPAGNYMLPGTASQCANTILYNPLLDPIGHQPDSALGRLDPCFEQGGVSIQQALYYRASRPYFHAADGSNIAKAALYAYSELLLGSYEPTEEASARRGNLVASPIRRIIILTDTMPSSALAEMQSLLALMDTPNQAVSVSFIVFNHPALSAAKRQVNLLEAENFAQASPRAQSLVPQSIEELERAIGVELKRLSGLLMRQ